MKPNPAERFRKNHPTTPTYGSGYQPPPEPKPNRTYHILGGKKPSIVSKIKAVFSAKTQMKSLKFTSWKTALAGFIGLAGTIVPQFWPEYAQIMLQIVGLATSLGLMVARDDDKTSEAVGAK